MAFKEDFALLTGNSPFPWQRRLYDLFVEGDIPHGCDLPTGLGKTSVIILWLLALVKNPMLPRRLVYVVNRRTVVDQSTAEAERLRSQLGRPEAQHLRASLDSLAVVPATHPIAISTLRGEFADNGAWRRDPSRPAIIVGTVDMIGSRLLFSGYGCGYRSKPLHAGFLGQDALVVHDEAHLEPAFQSLLTSIADEQRRCNEPRPLKVLALSATGRTEPNFSINDDDLRNEVVKKRLQARKGLTLHRVDDRKILPERIATKAATLDGKVIVFLSSVEHAEKCALALRKSNKGGVATLTGTMRGNERDELVKNPVFARFLPRAGDDVELKEGTVFLVATSAGEVGIDLSADHLVTDLPPFDSLAQRLGRVNRYGDGDAEVHVYCEELTAPARSRDDGDGDDDENDSNGKRTDEYNHARFYTCKLLDKLPERDDERRDASPSALRALQQEERIKASTPIPNIHHVDALLFDRWSYTTITAKLPGRPPVAEWLHGKAEWEPPRTTIAWRNEVAWLAREHLGREALDDFLADYPLRSRETLSDITRRVAKHLETLAARDTAGSQFVWLLRPDSPAEIVKLVELVSNYDPRKNRTLDAATVVLAPEAGGLIGGLFDGTAEFDPAVPYDLGPRRDERLVHEAEESLAPPAGMRLVRSVQRKVEGDEVTLWWHLYAASQRADDDGSRTSRTELLLSAHLQQTESWALRLAARLGLREFEQTALARAGRTHDLGKQRHVWQRSIKRFSGPPLAKGPMQPSELGHYRHELGSLHDGSFDGLDEEAKDLAMHVVAAHHGRARPHFPAIECFDPEIKDQIVTEMVRDVPLRFDRLQRRYGRWGLAWLESILRAADILGSEEHEVAE